MNRYPINPVPAPRMTRSDKWKRGRDQRPCVARYFAYRQEVQVYRVDLQPSGQEIVFVLPMPESWSAKKRLQMVGQPHQQRPDLDNLIKALKDSIFGEDAHLWDYRASKLWGEKGEIALCKMRLDREPLHLLLSARLKVEFTDSLNRKKKSKLSLTA